jgi:hypothetical protein
MRAMRFKLVKDNKVVGYEEWFSDARCWGFEDHGCWAYSIDGYTWKTTAIPHDSKYQFTGLRGKNRKEIYEKDIILRSYKIKNNETGEIKEWIEKDSVSFGYSEGDDYETESFYGWMLGENPLVVPKPYRNDYWTLIEEKFEVIGSTYENPELLS